MTPSRSLVGCGSTAVILAGGQSRRMGRDKAFLSLRGRRLIDIVLDRMAGVCDELLVVAQDVQAGAYLDLPAGLVEDEYRGIGVLGGLHAGLKAAMHEVCLVVGCDMPFLNTTLLQAFIEWSVGYDVVLMRDGHLVEPLHAVYRRTCLPAIEASIERGERRVVSFFPSVRVRYVDVAVVKAIDPTLRSFWNVNTPQDWERVRKAAAAS